MIVPRVISEKTAVIKSRTRVIFGASALVVKFTKYKPILEIAVRLPRASNLLEGPAPLGSKYPLGRRRTNPRHHPAKKPPSPFLRRTTRKRQSPRWLRSACLDADEDLGAPKRAVRSEGFSITTNRTNFHEWGGLHRRILFSVLFVLIRGSKNKI
jgi:hypothetical protein